VPGNRGADVWIAPSSLSCLRVELDEAPEGGRIGMAKASGAVDIFEDHKAVRLHDAQHPRQRSDRISQVCEAKLA
jgi:hypothetical protein